MSIKTISVKCPSCGAVLEAEEGRTQMFCSYCGSKAIIENDHEYVYRNINEADVKKAETDRMVKMKQLEMEEKDTGIKKMLIKIWLIATGILVVLGIIGLCADIEGLSICFIFGFVVGAWGALFLFISSFDDKKKTTVVASDQAEVTDDIICMIDRDWRMAKSVIEAAGFTNVKTYALNDLSSVNPEKNGHVKDISIGGKMFACVGDVFPKDAEVIITYHSLV